jgi:hypothetical protein
LEPVPKELFSIIVNYYAEEPFYGLASANYWRHVVVFGRRRSGSSVVVPNQVRATQHNSQLLCWRVILGPIPNERPTIIGGYYGETSSSGYQRRPEGTAPVTFTGPDPQTSFALTILTFAASHSTHYTRSHRHSTREGSRPVLTGAKGFFLHVFPFSRTPWIPLHAISKGQAYLHTPSNPLTSFLFIKLPST